jgi:hypothetical protein
VAPEPAKPENAWDKDPEELEIEALARSIDLQFEDPSKHESEEKADIDLQKPADDTK